MDCQLNKHQSSLYGKVQGNTLSNRPYEKISSDIMGPFKLSKHDPLKPLYIITFTDLFTRFTKIAFIDNITSKTIVKKELFL